MAQQSYKTRITGRYHTEDVVLPSKVKVGVIEEAPVKVPRTREQRIALLKAVAGARADVR